MIYLIYGPDSVSARSFLLNLRKNYAGHSTISGKRQTAFSLTIPREADLFGGKQLLIIENFVPKENETLPKVDNIDIVILTEEILSPPKWIDKSWVFKQPEVLSNFKLVDQVVNGQEKLALITLTKLLKQKTPPELIIGSLVRQFRLISLSLAGETEVVSRSSFVQQKTKEQARNWSLGKIRKALLLVLKSDFEIKNGIINSESVLTLLINKLSLLGRS